jgi:hypothetical protein
MRQIPPRRIVCLTEETVETLYLLGEQDRIVGVSDDIENSLPGIRDVHCVRFPVVAFRIASAPIHSGGEISRPMETRMPGNRNILYLIIGALIVAVGVLGYNLYQTRKQPEGPQINVGPSGLKIQNK